MPMKTIVTDNRPGGWSIFDARACRKSLDATGILPNGWQHGGTGGLKEEKSAMMGYRQNVRLCLRAIVMLGLSLAKASAQFQGEFHEEQYAQPPALYYTVMGEVQRPGVYELPQPNVRMTELVKLAGGLTAQSNKNILYFRRGRPGQSAFFMPDSTVELQAGDIVIADSLFRSSAGKTPARPASYVERTAINRNGPPKEPLVHVALVGLIDRPVVVPLRRESANFPMMFSLLRQDQNPARAVTIQVPRQQPVRFTAEDQEPLQLTTGTIVLFDEGSILRDTLPPLPDVIHPEAAVPRVSAPAPMQGRVSPGPKILQGMPAVTGPQTQAPAVRAPDSMSVPVENSAAPIIAPQTEDAKPAAPEESAPAQKPTDEPSAGVDNSGIPGPQFGFAAPNTRTTTTAAAVHTTKAAIRTISNSKANEAVSGPSLARVVAPTTISNPVPSEPAREEQGAVRSEKVGGKEAAEEDSSVEEESDTVAAKAPPIVTMNAGTGMMLFLGGLCVLCCAGMGWMFRDLRRLRTTTTTTTTTTSTPPVATQVDSPVRQILYDELPLVEENVPTRHEWHYQGRPQHLKPQRFDAAHVDEQGHSHIPQPHASFQTIPQTVQQPVRQPIQHPFAAEMYEEEVTAPPPLPPRYSGVTNSMRDSSGRTHRIDPQVNAEGEQSAVGGQPHSRRVPATPQQRDLSSSGILERVLASVQGGKHARRS